MVKTTELRQGNYLLLKWEVNKVACIASDNTIRFFSKDNSETHGCYGLVSPYWDIKPVELTPEILEKAGFVKDANGIYYKEAWPPQFPSQRFVIEYKDEVGFMLRSRYEPYNESATFKLLQYLHQLQNLYFALTGNELEIPL